MIEALKNEDLIKKVGGRFKLAALIQKRMKELMFGSRPLVEPGKMTPMEIVMKEIMDGKLEGMIAEANRDESDA